MAKGRPKMTVTDIAHQHPCFGSHGGDLLESLFPEFGQQFQGVGYALFRNHDSLRVVAPDLDPLSRLPKCRP